MTARRAPAPRSPRRERREQRPLQRIDAALAGRQRGRVQQDLPARVGLAEQGRELALGLTGERLGLLIGVQQHERQRQPGAAGAKGLALAGEAVAEVAERALRPADQLSQRVADRGGEPAPRVVDADQAVVGQRQGASRSAARIAQIPAAALGRGGGLTRLPPGRRIS